MKSISFLFLTLISISCFSQIDNHYIQVNNFNLLDDYNHSQIISLIGVPDEMTEGGQEVIDEFGYNTFKYRYGNSSIRIRNNYISDIFIRDQNLSINGIKIGDSISKVEIEFPKHNFRDDYYVVFLGDFPIVFFYDDNDPNGSITKIQYVVPL